MTRSLNRFFQEVVVEHCLKAQSAAQAVAQFISLLPDYYRSMAASRPMA
jgi:hypothetical protein